jgi:uncharacterized membrane protein YeaQ/YmgE (transglycosylase-associated protein family)
MGIILFLLFGLIVGAIARFVLPGKDPLGLIGTLVLGVIGSFIGGTLGSLFQGGDGNLFDFRTAGIIGSIIGAVIALLIWRAVGGRGRRAG